MIAHSGAGFLHGLVPPFLSDERSAGLRKRGSDLLTLVGAASACALRLHPDALRQRARPRMLYRSWADAEALPCITWLIAERSMGVITSEVGAGKTVAVRAVTAGGGSTLNRTLSALDSPLIVSMA